MRNGSGIGLLPYGIKENDREYRGCGHRIGLAIQRGLMNHCALLGVNVKSDNRQVSLLSGQTITSAFYSGSDDTLPRFPPSRVSY